MQPHGYKFIPTSHGVEIAIPDNLPPDQEATLIAQRLAEIDPIEVAAERKEIQRLLDNPGQCVAMEDVLRELAIDPSQEEDAA